ncbi:MAG TPA: iron-containing redox enzyme family protein [Acidimicrobiales bacterium]
MTALDPEGSADFARRIEGVVIDKWFRDPPPFLRQMATAPTKTTAQAFVLEWTKFSRQFPRWVGAVMANCPEFEVLAFEVENLMSEVVRDPAAATNHYELLIRLGEAAGVDRATIEAHEPCVEARRAFEWWWDVARQPDWLLGFTGINGLEIMGDRGLPRRYGLPTGTGLAPDPWAASGIDGNALEFFRVSDAADAGHGRETVELIAAYTPAGQWDEVIAVLEGTIARLRDLMDGLWTLSQRLALTQ